MIVTLEVASVILVLLACAMLYDKKHDENTPSYREISSVGATMFLLYLAVEVVKLLYYFRGL